MARTKAHRPYKFIADEDARPDGHDVQKHSGRPARVAVIAGFAKRRDRAQVRTRLAAQDYDTLEPSGSGGHRALYAAY